ncbi:MAG: hypothetical protein Q9M36_07310 [Sulfurovum sp.]|nr:hypothetical protein [Sulfurovum sp.]
MIHKSSKEAMLYIQSILDKGISVGYYRLKVFLQKHDISVARLNLVERRGEDELSLVSIEGFSTKNSINITLNSYSLINYLPLLYHRKDFLKRYLFGVQSAGIVTNESIFNIHNLFRAERTEYIDWLSSWFGIRYGDLTDEKGKRKIIANAVELYKQRGTKMYFITLIQSLIDIELSIDDNKHSLCNRNDSSSKEKIFTVTIEEKISMDKEEEARKYSIIKNIFDKEKPINTKMHLVYHYDIKDEDIVEQQVLIYDNMGYDYDSKL